MISSELNDRLTLVTGDHAAGRLLREYWQPVALVDELDGDRPVVPVTVFGERLVLYRDDSGACGLIDRHCPHRGADLCFGRLEDGGLRCAFHGWLFDRYGRCLEQPAEPAGSKAHTRLRHVAYPCEVRNGIVFAYLGNGEPPPFRDFDCFCAPDEFTFAFKGLIECNWLQALEVGIDPAHASFLHRFFVDEDPDESYGKQFRAEAASTGIPLTRILRDFPRPEINIEDTDYGLRILTTRDLDEETRHYRITNLVFPNAIAIPMSDTMTITQWHVPIDDENCYWYAIFTSFSDAVNKDLMRRQRLELYELPGYRPRANKSNNYGFDSAEQRNETYTGMGSDINVHDQWAVESLGAIQDRTREHLGKTDIAISRNRKLLQSAMNALEAGDAVPYREEYEGAADGGPIAIDALGPMTTPDCWQRLAEKRSESAPWHGVTA